MILPIFCSIIYLFIESTLSAPTYRYTCSWENAGPVAPYWFIAMSSNGEIQAAGDRSFLYLSTDAGATFEKREMVADAIAMSEDGSKLTAAGPNHVFVSNDTGLTWRNMSIPSEMTSAGMNPNGSFQILAGPLLILTSNDYGLSFIGHPVTNTNADSSFSSMSTEGQVQSAAYLTNSSYASDDFGAEFIQLNNTFGILPNNIQINWAASNTNYTSVLLAIEEGLYQSNNYSNLTKIMDGDFRGAAMSTSGRYQLVNSDSDYYISSDYGLTFNLGDGLPNRNELGNVLLSSSGEKALMASWVDDETLFEGRCDWGFNPYVTVTDVEHAIEVVMINTTVEVVVEYNAFR